jgi:hypothetical protein
LQHLLISFHADEVEQINMTEPANRWKSQVNQAVANSKHRPWVYILSTCSASTSHIHTVHYLFFFLLIHFKFIIM